MDEKLTFQEETHLTCVLNILVGDFMRPIYWYKSKFSSNQITPDNREIDNDEIYRNLFLWCVLTHRLSMAKIILSQMKTRICSALIASKILKSLVTYAPDANSRQTILTEADQFETYAIECVRCAYAYDPNQACELIIRRLDLYGGVTCLQMAVAANDRKFLNEDACDALLTKIWFDKIDPVREHGRLVVNLLTVGFGQFFFSCYDRHSGETGTRSLNKNVSEDEDDENSASTSFYVILDRRRNFGETTVSVNKSVAS